MPPASSKTWNHQLIDQHLSGKSVRAVIDSVLDESPSLYTIKQSMLKDLPKQSIVKIDEEKNLVYINSPDRHSMMDTIWFYERTYPEIEFVPLNSKERGKR